MDTTRMDKPFGLRELATGIKVILRNGMLQKRFFVAAISLTILYSIVNPADTYLIGRFIDNVASSKLISIPDIGLIPIYGGILFLWFLSLVTELYLNRARVLASLKLQELARTTYIAEMMGHVFRLPISYHRSVKIGEVQERMNTAAQALGGILGSDIVAVCPQFLSTLIFLGVLLALNKIAFLIAIVGVIAYLYATIKMVKPTVPLRRQNNAAYAKVRGIIMDSVVNIKIIKDFAAEKHQTESIRAGYQDEAMPVWYKLVGYRRTQSFVQNVIVACSRVCILILSVYLVRDGMWTIGSLVIANGFLGQIFNPISALSDNWMNIQNGIIALEDTEKIMNTPEEIYEPAESLSTPIQGKVSFANVSFRYVPEHPVLENISFTANPGNLVALVGESGVGKSTLIELISGYNFPNSGSIMIDDVPIQNISLSALRNAVGVVTQEITLFNDTIRNNLRFGNFSATDKETEAAAKRAHCDFIERFPEKWDQIVGERGLKLSVGQKQRVAIARAILKNPRILILDEPTSALDAGSEKIITESLDELMKGKTTFVVAHRLSTVRRADTILVFKNGSIVESGKHGELIRIPGGEYRRLYELQIGLHADEAAIDQKTTV